MQTLGGSDYHQRSNRHASFCWWKLLLHSEPQACPTTQDEVKLRLEVLFHSSHLTPWALGTQTTVLPSSSPLDSAYHLMIGKRSSVSASWMNGGRRDAECHKALTGSWCETTMGPDPKEKAGSGVLELRELCRWQLGARGDHCGDPPSALSWQRHYSEVRRFGNPPNRGPRTQTCSLMSTPQQSSHLTSALSDEPESLLRRTSSVFWIASTDGTSRAIIFWELHLPFRFRHRFPSQVPKVSKWVEELAPQDGGGLSWAQAPAGSPLQSAGLTFQPRMPGRASVGLPRSKCSLTNLLL